MSKQYKGNQFLLPEVDIPQFTKFYRRILKVSDLKHNKLMKNGIKYLSLSLFSSDNSEQETQILTNCHLNFDLIPEHPINLEESSLDEEFEPPLESSEIINASSILDRQLSTPPKANTIINTNLIAIHKYVKYVAKMNFKRNLNENPHLKFFHKLRRGNFQNMFRSVIRVDCGNMIRDSDLKALLPALEIKSPQIKTLTLSHSRLSFSTAVCNLQNLEVLLSCADLSSPEFLKSLCYGIPHMKKIKSLSISLQESKVYQPNSIENMGIEEIFTHLGCLIGLTHFSLRLKNVILHENVISAIASSINSIEHLTSIKFELVNCLRGDVENLGQLSSSIMRKSNLKELDLKLNGMTKFRYLNDIISNFGYMPKLKRANIQIDLHKITPSTWKSFLEFLSAHDHAEDLSLVFTDSNFEIDFSWIIECIEYIKGLKNLKLTVERSKLCDDEIIRRLGKTLLSLENLKTFQLDTRHNDRVTDDGLRDFCLVLRDSNFLDNVFMNLEGCDISLSGVYEFYAIFPNLTITSMDV